MAHYSTFDGLRRLSALAALAMTLMLPVLAHARAYGEKHLTRSTVLTEDQFGSIIIDADNVSLDCAGFQVHISSFTKPNCEAGSAKCGIVVANHQGTQIRNCNVVGEFYRGIAVSNASSTGIDNSSVTIGPTGEGIRVDSSPRLYVERVTLVGGWFGLDVFDSDQCYFGRSAISQASVAGIYSSNNTNSQFSENIIAGALTGFHGFGGYNETVQLSLFDGNNNSVVFEYSTHPVIAGNEIDWSGQNGIILISTDQALVEDNVATTSHSCDAKMLTSTNSRWYRNTFRKVCNDAPSHDSDVLPGPFGF